MRKSSTSAYYKKLLASTAAAFMIGVPFTMFAVEPADSITNIVSQINGDPASTITVNQPAGLNDRIMPEKVDGGAADITDNENEQTESDNAKIQTGQRKMSGYRIQVYSDSNAQRARNQAYAKKRSIESAFPSHRCYVSFNSPYWRVKVGDFKSKTDAEAVAVDIKRRFPAMANDIRVVRDRINAK